MDADFQCKINWRYAVFFYFTIKINALGRFWVVQIQGTTAP
jgi:hypothetical protein